MSINIAESARATLLQYNLMIYEGCMQMRRQSADVRMRKRGDRQVEANMMQRSAVRLWSRIASVLIAAVIAAIAFASFPSQAHAAADVASIKTVAQVQTDGALHVVEQRTYLFDESHAAIVWPLTAMEADSELEVWSVRLAHATIQGEVDGEWTSLEEVPFASDMRDVVASSSGLSAKMAARRTALDGAADASRTDPIPDHPSFCIDAHERALYLFIPPTEGRVVIECDLTITDAVRAFDDVAELYWDYVPADADAHAASVDVSVRLPLPDGLEAVAGQNVFAWGHGASGTVNVKADGTIAFRVPEVEEGQYAQAHVLFPERWLTNLSAQALRAHSGTRADDAKAEEEAWTDTWSAWLVNSLTVDIVFAIIGILGILGALGAYLLFGREPKASSSDDEASQGPSYADHEAPLIGRLFRWNHASGDDAVALLMGLQVRGAIKTEALEGAGPLGAGYEDLRIRTSSRAKDLVRTPIDQEAFRLLFDVWGEGYASVTLSDIIRHARADKERFARDIAGWNALLSSEVREAGFFDAKAARVQKAVLIAGCVLCAGALIFGVAGGSFMRGLALFLSGGACLVIGNYLSRRTPLGAEVEASALQMADALSDVSDLDCIPDADAPYLFAMRRVPSAGGGSAQGFQAHPRGAEGEKISFARFWLGGRRGRGGKPMPSLARRLSDELGRLI